MKSSDIAVIVPAHNEEPVIRACIKSLKHSLHKKQIYVVSDGSTDKTYRRARLEGCHVSYLTPGRGKAKAMIYLLERFRLFERYKLIFILDADTQIDPTFVPRALSLFENPDIAVIFGGARIHWPDHLIPTLKLYFVAYRERLNRMLQYLLIYAQTWKYTNVNYVIPGFCTIYRSKILRKLEIDTPGLLIEDFNLAFQLHKRKLGKIGHSIGLIGWDQHPDNLKDYWNQVRRWNIGFFQTIRKNGIWPSFFWLSLMVFTVEVMLNSIFMLILPILILFLFVQPHAGVSPILDVFINAYRQFGFYRYLTIKGIVLGVFVIDYLFTVVIGFSHKKPQFAIYGLFFIFMHVITSLILVSSIIPGFFSSSEGKWTSPARRAISPQ